MSILHDSPGIGNVGPNGQVPCLHNNHPTTNNIRHVEACAGSEGRNVNGLLSHHRQELRSSGLSDDTIKAAGIYSETDVDIVAGLLNWQRVPKKMVPAIVFPYLHEDGRHGYYRVKPDNPRTNQGKSVKYESPKGRPNEIYIPPNTLERLRNQDQLLLITEGEKKALALDQHGYACIGLVGVYGWKVKNQERLLPALERISWKGRDVRIVFDSDIQHNTDVQDAETCLAAHLARAGASVKVVRLPDGPPEADGQPGKIGADDYLVAHGIDAFRELLSSAEEPAEPDALQMKRPASSLDPCTEIEAFLALQQQDGVSRLRYWRGSWYSYRDGHYEELRQEEVQAMLIQHLNEFTTGLTTSVIANLMAQLKAQARLPGSVVPPAWIGPEHPPWNAIEVLACKDQLVHLPSLVTQADYSMPATPCFFTPVALDYSFNFEAGRPDGWLAFLDQLWPDDPQSIALLQEWFGYCLTTDTSQQKILMIVGPKRSGKGTIARVLRRLIGDQNVAGPTLASLGTNFGLWPLLGKSLAIISDARFGNRTDGSVVVERLLAISGEDALTIDRKHLTAVTCKLDTRLMLLTNELPRLADASGALAGRMLMLRLSHSWYGKEDPTLSQRLMPELPGILLWAIEGWRRLRERGYFVMPDASREIREELDDLTSPIGAFVRQRCEIGPDLRVSRNDLYQAYRTWCAEENVYRVSNREVFGRDLRAAVSTVRNYQLHDGTRFYKGIALRDPRAQQAAQQAQQVKVAG